MFAEFLLFLLVCPCGHSSVGANGFVLNGFLVVLFSFITLWGWGRIGVGGGSVPIYTCARRGGLPLITHISMVSSTLMWRGSIG